MTIHWSNELNTFRTIPPTTIRSSCEVRLSIIQNWTKNVLQIQFKNFELKWNRSCKQNAEAELKWIEIKRILMHFSNKSKDSQEKHLEKSFKTLNIFKI